MDPAEIVSKLEAARELIAAPERWTKGCYARDAQGNRVPERSPEAARWCFVGAICAQFENAIAPDVVFRSIHAALKQRRQTSIWLWNDADERVHAEVIAIFDAAIVIAKAAEMLGTEVAK